jgi:hypothetical protein
VFASTTAEMFAKTQDAGGLNGEHDQEQKKDIIITTKPLA